MTLCAESCETVTKIWWKFLALAFCSPLISGILHAFQFFSLARSKMAGQCRYNRVDPFMQKNPDVNHEPLEIEQLVRLGHARGPCPFYLTREMARTAELVFLPYNYLLDSRARGGLSMLTLENSVLIFDEAHNVEVCLLPNNSPTGSLSP